MNEQIEKIFNNPIAMRLTEEQSNSVSYDKRAGNVLWLKTLMPGECLYSQSQLADILKLKDAEINVLRSFSWAMIGGWTGHQKVKAEIYRVAKQIGLLDENGKPTKY